MDMGEPIWNYIELVSKDYCLHFTDKKTDTKRLSIMPGITQQITTILFCTQVNYSSNATCSIELPREFFYIGGLKPYQQ